MPDEPFVDLVDEHDLDDQPTVELERLALDATLPPEARSRIARIRAGRMARERERQRELETLRAENQRLHEELGKALLALDDPTVLGDEVAHHRALMLCLYRYHDYKAALRQLGGRASDDEVLALVERQQARQARNGWRQALTRRGKK
jgi:hypothetical protein